MSESEEKRNDGGKLLQFRRKFRKAVTGSEFERVRDHVHSRVSDIENRPYWIKTFDKLAFTLGVLNICATEYFVVAEPTKYWMWYTLIVPILLLARWKHFKANSMQYFLLDFCYSVNILTFVQMYLCPSNQQVFRITYILATGPLPAAIPVWMNSLVFHDVDRTVSVYIHSLPMCLYHTLRHDSRIGFGSEPLQTMDYLYALFFYACWQGIYLLQTEVVDKVKLENDARLLTSLKWLAADTRGMLTGGTLKILRKLGIFSENETWNSRDGKTKMVFIASQFIFTMLGMLPTYLCWNSARVSKIYICLIFTTAIYFGASYYVEVFSKKYAVALERAAERAVKRATFTVNSREEVTTNIAPDDTSTNSSDKDDLAAEISVYSEIDGEIDSLLTIDK